MIALKPLRLHLPRRAQIVVMRGRVCVLYWLLVLVAGRRGADDAVQQAKRRIAWERAQQ